MDIEMSSYKILNKYVILWASFSSILFLIQGYSKLAWMNSKRQNGNISNKRIYTCEKKDINTNTDVDIDKIISFLLNSESDNILWEQRKQNSTARSYS